MSSRRFLGNILKMPKCYSEIFVVLILHIALDIVSKFQVNPTSDKKVIKLLTSVRNTSIQKHQNFKNGLKAIFLANHLTGITQIKQ